MSILKPTKLILMGLRDGRIALLRGIGKSRRGPFSISVDTYFPTTRFSRPCQRSLSPANSWWYSTTKAP